MGANMDVYPLIGEIANKGFYTYQNDQLEIKNLNTDNEFQHILNERIRSIDKQENFSQPNNNVNEKRKKTVNREKEKIDSNPEENSKVGEVNKKDKNKPADSDMEKEPAGKKDDISDSQTENQNENDDEDDITEQNSVEVILEPNPNEITAEDLILPDDIKAEVDVIKEEDAVEITNKEIIEDNSDITVQQALPILDEQNAGGGLEELSADGQNNIISEISNGTNGQNKNVLNETEVVKQFNPNDTHLVQQEETKITETGQPKTNENLNVQLKSSEEPLTESELVDKVDKIDAADTKNDKKTDKVLAQQMDNNQTISQVNSSQNEPNLSFSQEQSADSSLADKNFDKTAEQIVTKDKESGSDDILKDFTAVTGQQDTSNKTRIVNAESELKNTNFKEIFQEKINSDEIIRQVQAKFNIRTAADVNYSEIKFRLNPDNLGEVSMKITMENNNLTARMRVENEAVKEIFQANLEQLRKSLDSQGVKVEKIEVTLKNDTSNMGNFAESNSTHERNNKRNNNMFSAFRGFSTSSEDNDDKNITLTSRNRRDGLNRNDGHVDYFA